MIEETRPGAAVGDATAGATAGEPVGDGAVGPDPGSDTASSGGDEPPPAPRASVAPGGPRLVRSLVIGSVIAIALAVFLFVGLGTHSGKGPAGPVVAVGSQAPGFSLPPLTGSVPVDLDALGKDAHHPVILNFFASWCTPCQEETPLLAKAAAAEQAKGGPVRFVGVDVNDPPTKALPFVEKAGITYPVGVDQSFRVSSGLYGLNGLPQTFVIDSDGRVVAHFIGAVDAADLRRWTKKLGGTAT